MDAYDRKGKKLTTEEWAVLHADFDYKRVAVTHILQFMVSTVWLGLDHSWGGGTPVIFETMVFEEVAGNSTGSGLEEFCERYCTEEEALAGHNLVVQTIADGGELALLMMDA